MKRTQNTYTGVLKREKNVFRPAGSARLTLEGTHQSVECATKSKNPSHCAVPRAILTRETPSIPSQFTTKDQPRRQGSAVGYPHSLEDSAASHTWLYPYLALPEQMTEPLNPGQRADSLWGNYLGP